MGSLYLACQGEAGLEKLCVVKTVLKQLADSEYLTRFRDEAKTVVKLSHGNLVPVFDASTAAGELYIAMDYVDGKDLRAVWNRCAKKVIAFPVDVAVHLVRELLRGLHHAHTFGDLHLVHRDVSPPNILLAFSGEVKLTDFGLASSTLKVERTAPGVVYGKVSYMSPEQARGEPLDGRTDLYACGIILWELLTGRQLFPSSEGEVLPRVRDPKVQPPSTKAGRVTPKLDAIVMRSLNPERGDRYGDCEEFRAALAEYLATEAPTTDAARVSAFLRELFGDEIEVDRKRRDQLVEAARSLAKRDRRRRRTPTTPPMDPVVTAAADAKADDSIALVGTLVGERYRVQRLIGEGGMGRVYEAEHVEIGKRVAIKVLHPCYTQSADAVARFRREARAAARLGHPNIVDVTDSGTTPSGAVYFVMELLEGEDLGDLIAAGSTLPVERVIHIGVQLARALDAAHAAGIVHRDLKPENVFLVQRDGQDDFVKVLDFGIAHQMEGDELDKRLTHPGMAMGTPEYMAPEQAAGQPADARSDIYALGAILYELLASVPPHTGENFMEVLTKKSHTPARPLEELRPEVSPELSSVVASALAIDPKARPVSMAALAQALGRSRPDRRARRSEDASPPRGELAAGPTAPTPVSVPERMAPRRSHRGLIWSSLAVAASASVVVAGRLRWTPPAPSVVRPVVIASPTPAEPPVSPSPERSRATPTSHPRPLPSLPKRPLPTLGEAQRLYGLRQIDEAERVYRELTDNGVARGGAAAGLSRIALDRGDLPSALRLGRQAVEQGGGTSAHIALGNALFKVRRYSDAMYEYRAALATAPDNLEARRSLAAAQRKANGG